MSGAAQLIEAAQAVSRDAAALEKLLLQMVVRQAAERFGCDRSEVLETSRGDNFDKPAVRARFVTLYLLATIIPDWTHGRVAALTGVSRGAVSRAVRRIADARDEDPALDRWLDDVEAL